MKEIYKYYDYRQFLRDRFDERKKQESFFSFRFMSNRLGMDHSLLVKIFTGKRHLADRSIDSMANFFGLNKSENDYFHTLIAFEKAKTEPARKEQFERLLSLQSCQQYYIGSDKHRYFSNWHIPAMRSLLDFYRFTGDYEELGKQMNPPISAKKARESIELLTRLELIRKSDDGSYELCDANITTGDSWESLSIRAFQQEAIRLSAESLDRDPKEIRDISSVTMSVDRECFEDIREILREARSQIIKRVNSIEGDRDRLYQLNMQCIPLSVVPEDDNA